VAGDDVHEVCNYLDAIKYAREQIKSARGLPLSIRLLNEAHRRLMREVRGANKQPGEIRRSQNWIGGTRPGNAAFVPAPPEELTALLADLEKYLHTKNGLPPLVRIGLAHVQFETIHPYLDGNGHEIERTPSTIPKSSSDRNKSAGGNAVADRFHEDAARSNPRPWHCLCPGIVVREGIEGSPILRNLKIILRTRIKLPLF
jgi:hypothetical protein